MSETPGVRAESNNNGEIIQFGLAGQYGNVGLLAHNNLSGRLFANLAVGQQVRLVYGDGKVESFVSAKVFRYQALQPTSPYSSFRNMDDDARQAISADQMFRTVYMGNRHVTFQTCIEAYGNSSWGRLFVIDVPKSEYLSLDRPNIEKYQ